MKYDIISDSASLITGAYALVNIQEILSIVILVLSIINILFNMVIIILKIKNMMKFQTIFQPQFNN